MGFDLNVIRPPAGRELSEVIEDFYEDDGASWPTPTPTPAERSARSRLSELGEVFADTPHELGLTLSAECPVEEVLSELEVLAGLGYVVLDPQSGATFVLPEDRAGLLTSFGG